MILYPSQPHEGSRTVSYFNAGAAIALAAANLLLGTVAAIADPPEQETPSAATADKQETKRDRRRQAAVEAREEALASEAGKNSIASDIESKIVVYTAPEQTCRKESVAGSRVPKVVCTTVVQQDANDTQNEETARDFLRRLSERSTITTPADSPFTTSTMPGF
jgi:hypothetical protein